MSTAVVATIPMRGPGDGDREDDERAHDAAEQHPLRRAERFSDAGQRAACEDQHRERDDRSDERRGRDRLEASDAVAEASLNGDLHRSAEAGGDRKKSRYSGRAHAQDAIRSPASPTKERT